MSPYLKIHPKYVSQLQNCRTVLDGTGVVPVWGLGRSAGTTVQGPRYIAGLEPLADQAVPEPATLGLVAAGALGLLLLKRRKAV